MCIRDRSRTEQLAPGRLLRHMPVVEEEPNDQDYRVGYVAGMTKGDGTFRYEPGWRSDKEGCPQSYWRVALMDLEPLQQLKAFLAAMGVGVEIRPFDSGPNSTTRMWKVETRALSKLATIHDLLRKDPATRNYRRGYLAGFFDAEGHNGSSPRISQKQLSDLERVRVMGASLGFEMKLEKRCLLYTSPSPRDRTRSRMPSSA